MSDEEILVNKKKQAESLQEILLLDDDDGLMNKAITEYAWDVTKTNSKHPIVCYDLFIEAIEKQLDLKGSDYRAQLPEYYSNE